MSIFDKLLKLRFNIGGNNTPPAVEDLNPQEITLSGSEALKVNTVYACINVISNSVAALPFDLYRRTGSGREKAIKHRLYKLTKYPSIDTPGFNFKEALAVNLLIWGNAYIEIVKTGGAVRELNLIPSEYVHVSKKQNGEYIYTVQRDKGPSAVFSSLEGGIMPIAGKSYNGREGLSPVDLGLRSIKLSKALENFGLQYFERGARPSGFLKTPHKLSEKAFINLKRSFMQQYMGSANSGKMIVLEDGLDYVTAQNGNSDSQFLQARQYQVEEIARIFNVPLFMLQSTEKTTSWGSGLETLNNSYLTHCLLPILRRIEEAYNFYLLTDKEKADYYFEFNTEGLLRADTKTRFEAYHTGIMDGWLSPNDVRTKENMPAIEGGNVYYMPVNMAAYAGPDRAEDNRNMTEANND